MSEKYLVTTAFKIISGGQTGADRAGLDWALGHGLPHGGWCPKGRRSEEGPIGRHYQLTETPTDRYLQRTEWNVRDSDATLIFTLSEQLDGGSKKTADFANKQGKPWKHVYPALDPKFVVSFLNRNRVKTLNIAGKRESSAPGVSKWVTEILDLVLQIE